MLNWLRKIFGGKPKRNFPSFASAQCHGALNEAVGIVKKVGRHKLLLRDLKVRFVAGEKQFGLDWAYKVDARDYKGYALGMCYGELVEVGIDPSRQSDPAAVRLPTLVHEFVHHLTGAWHDPCYDGLVPGWRSARESVGKHKQMAAYGVWTVFVCLVLCMSGCVSWQGLADTGIMGAGWKSERTVE